MIGYLIFELIVELSSARKLQSRSKMIWTCHESIKLSWNETSLMQLISRSIFLGLFLNKLHGSNYLLFVKNLTIENVDYLHVIKTSDSSFSKCSILFPGIISDII